MESIPRAPVAWRATASNRVVVPARQAGNRFLGSLKGLQIRALGGQYVKKGLSYKPARLGIDSWAPSKVYKFGLCYLSEFLIVQCAVFLQNYIQRMGSCLSTVHKLAVFFISCLPPLDVCMNASTALHIYKKTESLSPSWKNLGEV